MPMAWESDIERRISWSWVSANLTATSDRSASTFAIRRKTEML